MKLRTGIVLTGLLVGLVLSATSGLAQSIKGFQPPTNPTPPGRSPSWGNASLTSYTAGALEFQTFSQTDTWTGVGGSPNRYLTAAGNFEVAVHLPNGASIESIEIEGCDTTAVGQLSGALGYAVAPAGSGLGIASFATGAAGTPGCALFSVDVIPPVTVDNQNNKYWFELTNSTFDGSTVYAAARIYYRLQVSPPPGVPTFSDVGLLHPFFQFVEALAASGITAGYPDGRFGVDDPISRGQAAVFFAKALGLHWPN